ncbi:MAG: FHA domain-containing protein [Gammaproteobacteria bacterium]|nr:FHA domain-containing protein [Gammaproteobacteria bacterium]MBU1440930.1 FHA domain-containing protein [Gammaproteobacteria bacterium]MBU2285341.1 FHA domain-containing protein [Gammaproteobacteria bacterium]
MPKLILHSGVGNIRQFTLAPPSVTIGRATVNDIVLDSARASRFHAVIEFTEPFVIIRDLGGRNGTWVNGKRVEVEALGHGDTLVMGDCKLRFLADEVEVVSDADLKLMSVRGDLLDVRRR